MLTHHLNYERDKMRHWISTSEKLLEISGVSCGKDSKRYHKSFPKASEADFTVANASHFISMLPNICKKFASPINIRKHLTILETKRLSNSSSA